MNSRAEPYIQLSLGRDRPTATAGNRGVVTVERGDTGVADAMIVSRKNAADAYEWFDLTTAYQPLDADLTVIAGLSDPNADRILFWDDSAGSYAYLTAGTGLAITGTTIDASAAGAPSTATYITQTPDAGLSAEQSLSSLTTGLVKVTNGTGALSTAAAGTDYVVSQYDYGKGWRPNVSKPLSLAEFTPQTARVAVTSDVKIRLL